MEFPDLGKHCSEQTCKQLDFLPFKCDVCERDFCKDHYTCAAHKCPFAFKKDVQVPVCPLCNSPVPVRRGEVPDAVVGEHMDRDCQYRPGKREKEESEPVPGSVCTLNPRPQETGLNYPLPRGGSLQPHAFPRGLSWAR